MKWKDVLPPVLLALILLVCYLSTIAPGLTWANNGADGGDLITATMTGGVPHPTGYPTYLLIAELFHRFPLGTIPFRMNLLSTVAAILAALTVYGILCWLPNSPAYGNRLSGLISGLMFGLSPLVWSQAIITEVYTLHAFFTALVVLLALWLPNLTRYKPLEWITGIVLGLATGNHLTSIFLIPPVVLSGMLKNSRKLEFSSFARMSAGLIVGSLVYLALPIRALSGSPVNWGNPVSFQQFVWLVTGQLYQRRLANLPFAGILDRMQDLVELILRQFELPGIILALIGLIFFFKPSRIYFITLWNAVIFTVFSLLYASHDSFLYLIPVILSFSIWIGLGFTGLFQVSRSYGRVLKTLVVVILGVFIGLMSLERAEQLDLSQDVQAEQFGQRMMEISPQKAILFATGDEAIFTLWYFHFGLKQRPDLTVIATDLLHFEWYDQTLRTIYPNITWSEGFLWAQTITSDNPSHPACTVSLEQAEEIVCGPAK